MLDFLRQADPMLRQLFDGIGEGALVVDLDGNPLFCNAAAERILGSAILQEHVGSWMDRAGVFSADGVTPLPREERPLPRAIRGEQVTNQEFVITREGDACLLNCTARPLLNPAGKVVGGVAIFRDITEQRKVEKELRASERRYRTLASHLPSAVVLMFDRSLHFTLADGGGLAAAGFTPAQIEGRPVAEYATESLLPSYAAVFDGTSADTVIERAGRPFRVQLVPVRDEHEHVEEGLMVGEDISQHVLSEQVRRGEQHFRLLVETIPQIVWTSEPNGEPDYYNQRWFDYTGMTLEQTRGWGWEPVLHPDDLQNCVDAWSEAVRTGDDYEVHYRFKRAADGQYRWHLGRARPVRNPAGEIVKWFGTCTDIDDQKRAEERNLEKYELLVRSVQGYAILMLDPEGRITTWNDGATSIKLYEPAEIIGEHFSRFYPPEDLAVGKPARDLEIAARTGSYHEEGWRLRKDGSRFWADVLITALKGEGGVLLGFANVTRDDSARKKLAEEEENRRRIEEERDQLFALSADLIGVASFDGHFRRVNPSWSSTLGWTSEELTACPSLDFVHPDDLERTIAAGSTLASGANVSRFQNRYRTKNGEYRWLEWTAVPLLAEKLIYCIGRDVTDAKAAEESKATLEKRLVVADRMASVGTLAAGAAHEINNPLAYVTANLDLVVEEIRTLSGGSPSARMKDLEEMVLEAREGAERVRKIVRGLKTFSRAEEERRGVMDVKPTLELAINMSFNEIRHRARLVKDYGETPLIEADDARLGQVFINLLVNAAQAIPEGNAEGNEIRIVTSTDTQGRAVVEIRDTGPGIPEAIRARIFEPFFTTKGVGVGTGLGLSICHNIVTGMDGEISVSSAEGRGTSFRVVLPAARVQKLPGTDGVSVSPAMGRRANVLVVDDEPAVGMVLSRILREHDVRVVTSAKDALEILASGKRFDVIFSDLMMPQMTGMDFYEELRRRSPEDAGRIVFATGGAFTPAAAEFLDQVGNERIEKPFTPKTVREMVLRFID